MSRHDLRWNGSSSPRLIRYWSPSESGWGRLGGLLRDEISIDRLCAVAAFADGPDHQRLTSAHVAAGKDALARGSIIPHVRLGISLRGKPNPRILDRPGKSGTDEAHRQKDKVGPDLELASRDRLNFLQPIGTLHQFRSGALQ